MAVAWYAFYEISTFSSWMLPIWQLQGIQFVKSQLIVAHSVDAEYNICEIKTFQLIVAHMAVAGYVFCEISTLSSLFNRSVYLKQVCLTWAGMLALNSSVQESWLLWWEVLILRKTLHLNSSFEKCWLLTLSKSKHFKRSAHLKQEHSFHLKYECSLLSRNTHSMQSTHFKQKYTFNRISHLKQEHSSQAP